MKRLTLDQTWKLCLSMWRWIAKQIREGSKERVRNLKRIWVDKHGYTYIMEDCFFCEYTRSHDVMCYPNCPGKKVDIGFSCTTHDNEWSIKPIAFYNKLVSVNRKRLAKRKK